MYWVEVMQKCNLFQNLSEDEIRSLLSITKQVMYRSGQVVFERGDQGDSLFLILEGAVSVIAPVTAENQESLTVLEKGDHFGEMALIDTGSRSATIVAKHDVKLLQIDKSNFDRILAQNMTLEIKVLWNMARDFTSIIRRLNEDLAFMRLTLRQDFLPPDSGT
ncbi:cyclic nucleotide-binding domain-containing protein [candidate division CSSED10-310 bacterium]|uniref:Cyclic nucleotide-binding domain-containing protein n=1 Tax=candidate division CSSED10-310 bacterium TaxID=2855610 RepID=A0ABV6Z5C4_UNCC1